MAESHIPELTGTSKKAASAWLSTQHKRGLLFCLDDNPFDIWLISDGSRFFTDSEAHEVSEILTRPFDKRGDELHARAYEVLSKTFHTRAERRALNALYG